MAIRNRIRSIAGALIPAIDAAVTAALALKADKDDLGIPEAATITPITGDEIAPALSGGVLGKITYSAIKAWMLDGVSSAWADITGKPTTLAGYGITDAEPAKGTDDNYVTDAEKANIGNLSTAAYTASTDYATAAQGALAASASQPGHTHSGVYAASSHTHVSADVTDASTGGNGATDYGKLVKFGGEGGGITFAGTNTFGVSGYSANGNGVKASSSTGNALSAVASGNGVNYHATFGNSGDDRSFVARLLGALGWWRGAYTLMVSAVDTLTANRVQRFPDKDGTVALTSDVPVIYGPYAETYAALVDGRDYGDLYKKTGGTMAWVSLDPLVAAFQTASGATSTESTDKLTHYLRSQSLENSFRLFPGESSRGAPSGATMYGVGGWTSNNAALADSPTYGASGLGFNGSTQNGSITDWIGSLSALTIIVDAQLRTLADNDALVGQYDGAANKRSWVLNQYNSGVGLWSWRFITAPSGTAVGIATWLFGSPSPGDMRIGFRLNAAGTSNFLLDGTVQTAALTGTPAATFNSDVAVTIASYLASGAIAGAADIKIRNVLLIGAAVSDAQYAEIDAILSPSGREVVWWGDSMTQAAHYGFADSGATTPLTAPPLAMSTLMGNDDRNYNRGVAGETASQIAARAATAGYYGTEAVIWAGANDSANADESAVVDSIAAITTQYSKYLVITPLLNSAWNATQKTNVTNIRNEIISRFPSANVLDAWTAVGHVTVGEVDTGYRRYNSAGVEDTFHPGQAYYDLLIPAVKAKLDAI